jgi:hypothetical protein
MACKEHENAMNMLNWDEMEGAGVPIGLKETDMNIAGFTMNGRNVQKFDLF